MELMTRPQITFTCCPGGPFLLPMADPSAKVNVATVPCKYKVGRVLGQGTYAVVKGAITALKRVQLIM